MTHPGIRRVACAVAQRPLEGMGHPKGTKGPQPGILLTKLLPKRPINPTFIPMCSGWATRRVTVRAAQRAQWAPSSAVATRPMFTKFMSSRFFSNGQRRYKIGIECNRYYNKWTNHGDDKEEKCNKLLMFLFLSAH